MSALAGIIYPDSYQVSNLVKPMLDVQSHRSMKGNEEQHIHQFRNFQFGSVGSPLRNNERRTCYVGLDGSLSNAPALRKLLKKSGFAVHTQEDSELILHAYEHWGEGFSRHLEGTFSIVLFDQERERIVLVRDRLGVRPLYWSHIHQHFIFSSELKGILATGVVPQTPSMLGIGTYLALGFLPQDLTPVEQVNKLLPGYQLSICLKKQKSIQSYWSLSSLLKKEAHPSPDEAAQSLYRNLSLGLESQLHHTSGPLGCFVLGGHGSATVASLMKSSAQQRQITALTSYFEGENEEDRTIASQVCSSLHLPQKIQSISPSGLFDHLTKLVWYLDEPLADPNVLSIWALTQIASKEGIQSVFSGMGADELLGDHTRYHVHPLHLSFSHRLAQIPQGLLRGLVLPIASFIHKPLVYQILRHTHVDPLSVAYTQQHLLFTDRMRSELSPLLGQTFDLEVFLQKFYRHSEIPSRMAALTYFDIKTKLTDCYIHQLERLCTAQNITWNSPFLHRSVLEFLLSLSPESKFDFSNPLIPLQSHSPYPVPEAILKREKQLRPQFLQAWAQLPEFRKLLRLLEGGTLVQIGFISKPWLQTVLSSHPIPLSFQQLWGLFVLEVWFRIYLNHPVTGYLPPIPLDELLAQKS